MFGFIKRLCIGLLSVSTIGSFGESLVSNFERHIKCMSISNRLCQARPALIDINPNETLFYPFTVRVDKKSVVEVVIPLMIHVL